MTILLIIIGILAVIFTVLWLYIRKNVLLPSHVDRLIEEIKTEPLPEFRPGIEKFVTNGNVVICCEIIEPKGEALGTIMLLNGHSQTMLGFPIRFFMAFVNAGYRVIRMDNRGLGMTSWLNTWTKETSFNLEDMASDVIAVLDFFEIRKVHLAGYSMGGMIAQRVAINHPNRLVSLTSMMSAAYFNDPTLTGLSNKFKYHFLAVALVYARNLKSLESKLKLHLAINRMLKGKGYEFEDKEVLQKAWYECTRRNGYTSTTEKKHTRAIVKSGSRYEELKTLKVPTLVIHGTLDPLVLFENAEKYAPLIPNVKTLFIKDLGHHYSFKHTPQIVDEMLSHFSNTEV